MPKTRINRCQSRSRCLVVLKTRSIQLESKLFHLDYPGCKGWISQRPISRNMHVNPAFCGHNPRLKTYVNPSLSEFVSLSRQKTGLSKRNSKIIQVFLGWIILLSISGTLMTYPGFVNPTKSKMRHRNCLDYLGKSKKIQLFYEFILE